MDAVPVGDIVDHAADAHHGLMVHVLLLMLEQKRKEEEGEEGERLRMSEWWMQHGAGAAVVVVTCEGQDFDPFLHHFCRSNFVDLKGGKIWIECHQNDFLPKNSGNDWKVVAVVADDPRDSK
eukprot:Sdes_comp9834_c0_seq1m1375